MNRALFLAPLMVLLSWVTALGCNYDCGDAECMFNSREWKLVQTLSPLPDPPVDTTNKYLGSQAAVRLGQKFFFETRYSGAIKVGLANANGGLGAPGDVGKVGCVSCHDPNGWFIDSRSNPNNMSLGASYTKRNAPSLVNQVYYKWHGWAGKQDSLWNQGAVAAETPTDAASDRCTVARTLCEFYRDEYDAIFDAPLPCVDLTDTSSAARFRAHCKPKANATDPDGVWERMPGPDKTAILTIMANLGKSLAAWESRLISRNAPFDLYVAGQTDAISESAKRGLRLFIDRAACIDCHNGPYFTDQSFHNLGVPQTGPNVPATDLGRYGDVPVLLSNAFNSTSKFSDDPGQSALDGLVAQPSDTGKFKTATLRGVAMTKPYMHTGGFDKLTDVVEFYNYGGGASGFSGDKDPRIRPLGLSPSEVADVVSFLMTLTGEPVPAALTQPPS